MRKSKKENEINLDDAKQKIFRLQTVLRIKNSLLSNLQPSLTNNNSIPNTEIVKRFEKLLQETEEQKNQIKELTKENKQLGEIIDKLKGNVKENEELKKQIDQLTIELLKITKEFNEFKSKVNEESIISRIKENYSVEVNELIKNHKAEIDQLLSINEKLNSQLEEMTKKCELYRKRFVEEMSENAKCNSLINQVNTENKNLLEYIDIIEQAKNLLEIQIAENTEKKTTDLEAKKIIKVLQDNIRLQSESLDSTRKILSNSKIKLSEAYNKIEAIENIRITDMKRIMKLEDLYHSTT